jgi:hypothetical protein
MVCNTGRFSNLVKKQGFSLINIVVLAFDRAAGEKNEYLANARYGNRIWSLKIKQKLQFLYRKLLKII